MADYRTFRVSKPFNWNGMELKPGDVWLVDMSDGRASRVEALLGKRYAHGDATAPSGEDAAKDPVLRQQLPEAVAAR